jgi:putative inorganic carbon (hco3(-)) transporter
MYTTTMNSTRLQKTIIFLFHLLFLTVPFFFTWVNEELFEFPKMLLTYGFTSLIVGLWIARMVVEKKPLIRQTVFDWPLLIFVASQALSTMFSIHPSTSIMGYYTRFHGGLLSTLAYVLLFYASVNNFSKKDLKKLWLTILIAALGITLYAIPEHLGKSPSCLLITGSLDVSCWVQDVKNRVFATFGQPNWLAAYTITLIPMGIIFCAQSKKVWQQLLAGLTTITLFLTLLYTQSRSGFMGFVIGTVGLISGLLWIKYKNKSFDKAIMTRYLGLSGILLIIMLINGSPLTPALTQIFKTQDSPPPTEVITTAPVNRLEAGGTDSGEIRKIVWQGSLDVWKRYPLFGSGVETFAYSYYQDRPLAHNQVSEWDFLYNKAHNELLNFLATTGIVGLGSYLLLLSWFGVVSLKIIFKPNPKNLPTDQSFTLAMLSGVIALSVSNFFGFSTVMVSVLLFIILASVAITHSKEELDPASKTTATLSTGQFLQLSFLAIATLMTLIKISKIWQADKAYAAGKSYIEAGYAVQSLEQFQTAIRLRPKEALFRNDLADTYSKVAIALSQQGQSTASAEFRKSALAESALALRLNPRHLNYYKTQARVLITLSQLEPALLEQSVDILETALKLAPTDAKLMYNLSLVKISLGQTEVGIEILEKTIAMKTNYEAAHLALAKQYEALKKIDQAQAEYQFIYDHITTSNQLVNQKIEELK